MVFKKGHKLGFKKGYTPWNKDKKCPELGWSKGLTKETDKRVKKLSEANKGRAPWNKGKEMWKNKKHPFLGKTHSEKTKKKLSKAGKGKHTSPKTEFKKGQIPWNKGLTGEKSHMYHKKNHFYGKKHSEETREKMKITRAKQVTPKKDTSIEVKVQEFLKVLGINFFTHQYMKEIEHGYQCDILIPSMNLVIECDGDYWHKYPTGNNIDHIRTKELIEQGFKVLRLWEREIKTMNLNDFNNMLRGIK